MDPALASTGQAYGYGYDNPANASDRGGLDGPGFFSGIRSGLGQLGQGFDQWHQQARDSYAGAAIYYTALGTVSGASGLVRGLVGLPGLAFSILQDPSAVIRATAAGLGAQLDGTLSLLRRAVRCNDPRIPYYLLGKDLGGTVPLVLAPELDFAGGNPLAAGPEGRPAFDAPAEGDALPPEGDPLPVRESVSCAAACFPAGTEVATTTGQQGIETLRVGDRVLVEDPASGAVRPEAVTATIDDGVKPLVAVALSDGSSILATPNHAFFVEGGPGLTGAAWVQAGELQAGDRLRTAGGGVVWVVGLRYHAGYARVHTLTVATDPSTRLRVFFVGSLRVQEVLLLRLTEVSILSYWSCTMRVTRVRRYRDGRDHPADITTGGTRSVAAPARRSSGRARQGGGRANPGSTGRG